MDGGSWKGTGQKLSERRRVTVEFNPMRWQLIADHNEWPNRTQWFVAFFLELARNYWEVINLLFVLPGLYLNVLKTEKILQFWRLTACAGNWLRTITSDRTVHNNSSLSFSFELVDIISLDRNYWEVINLLFVLPGLENITILEEFSTSVVRHSSARG